MDDREELAHLAYLLDEAQRRVRSFTEDRDDLIRAMWDTGLYSMEELAERGEITEEQCNEIIRH